MEVPPRDSLLTLFSGVLIYVVATSKLKIYNHLHLMIHNSLETALINIIGLLF